MGRVVLTPVYPSARAEMGRGDAFAFPVAAHPSEPFEPLPPAPLRPRALPPLPEALVGSVPASAAMD
eukprot:CAMPEP_0195595090 /NCGR_PEP_ID=MMETSP0815-20121206/1756_1 /TAXON_ID=97485 /ORGANISM="Prymnesium parvum, Strain Texoma1" /LENGTH=66 /DNA_ID=CAMNT_0040734321 /DNA_START=15 /DNA_END=216 /DNA_ORIENTATION=+